MKPYRILSTPLFLASWLLAVATTLTAHAREPTAYERFCLETMGRIESTLAAHLPSDCEIVATHPSPLGQRFAQARYIRDAWISRNGKVAAKVVLFTWPLPDDPLLAGAAVSQVRLETDTDGKKIVLGIAVIGEDTQLVDDVINMVNRSGASSEPDLKKPGREPTKKEPAAATVTIDELREDLIGRTLAVTVKGKSRSGGPTPPPGTDTDVGDGGRIVGILESFSGDTIVLRFDPIRGQEGDCRLKKSC